MAGIGRATMRGRGWRQAVAGVALAVAALGGAAAAGAQTAPGGLVSLPGATAGWIDFLENGGFEEPGTGQPADWTPSPTSAWALAEGRTGGLSYRFTNASGPEAYQEHYLTPGTYKLSGWMRTEGKGNTGSARFRVDFRPGGFNDWKHTQEISGTTPWTLYELTVNVPAAYANAQGLVRTHVMLDGYWARPGLTAYYDDVKFEQQRSLPLEAFMRYPNYRGTLFAEPAKQDVEVQVTINDPAALATPAAYEVVSRIAREGSTTPVEELRHPLTSLTTGEKDLLVSLNRLDGARRPIAAAGSYLVTFALAYAGGGDVPGLLPYPAYRVNKTDVTMADPDQPRRIAFNEKNQVLLNGTARFVLGVYDAGIGYDKDWESTLWSLTGERRMSGLRINMYLNYHFGDAPASAMNALMANLDSHDVVYLQTGNCFANYGATDHVGPDGDGFEIDVKTPAYITGPGGIAPLVGGYYVADECGAQLVPEVFQQYKQGLVTPGTGLQVLDPDSMTFAALFGNKDLILWRDAVDVLSTDPYPMYGPEPSGGYPHIQVADWTAMARAAVQDARPFFTVLQFFKFDAGRRQGRWPTFYEMRNHAYMAVAENARGLFWWSLGENGLADACRGGGWCAERTAHMEDLKRLVGELASMETVLLADDSPGSLTGNTNPAIRTKVKFVNGVGYVIAYNSTNIDGVSTSFTWPSATAVTVNELVEGQPLTVTRGTFADTFKKYEAKVYRITF